ncbi:hypothetical protein A2U01_0053666, partial [Trifolium medium]|nr:hypothetical protein [Trifolium medium]
EHDVENIEDSDEDIRQDVGHDVVNIGITGRKKIGGQHVLSFPRI